MQKTETFRAIGVPDLAQAEALFIRVFTAEPWNDDWSDRAQLHQYLLDLVEQRNSLAYGLFASESLIGMALGRVKHWCTGTEYEIDELCVHPDCQGVGVGTRFLNRIAQSARAAGCVRILLQTARDVPAFDFYQKNGFIELESHVSLYKPLGDA